MALAAYVLMPQTFVRYATTQDSLLLLFDILPAYVRRVRSQLEQRLNGLSFFAAFFPIGCSFLNKPQELLRPSRMKAGFCLFGSNLLLAACSEAISYTYSKANFTTPAFEADLSTCKHFKSSTAYQASPRSREAATVDGRVRDCMKAKGYKIEMEAR